MKQMSMFLISFIGFLGFLIMLFGVSCNVGGIHDWRGNKAVFLGLFIALSGAVSIITLFFQLLKASQIEGSGANYILAFFVLLLVGLYTVMNVSGQFCH